MLQPRTYSIDQIATAARELRQAAGADEERFTGPQVAELLGGEIQILRERGFTDDRIAHLLNGFDIDLKPGQIERRSRTAGNLIRRMLWNRIPARPEQLMEPASASPARCGTDVQRRTDPCGPSRI